MTTTYTFEEWDRDITRWACSRPDLTKMEMARMLTESLDGHAKKLTARDVPQTQYSYGKEYIVPQFKHDSETEEPREDQEENRRWIDPL